MVEQADAGEGHGDVVLVAGHDDMVVADGATSLGDVLDPTLVGTLDIVAEGEEGVGAKGYAGVLGNPGALLFQGQHGGLQSEELLPGTVAKHVVVLVLRDIDIDGVVAVGTTDALLEGQGHDLRVLAQPPDVGLVAGEAGTVDAALLTSTDADGLTILDVADGVGLGVLQRDEGDDEVAAGFSSKGFVLRGDIFKQGGIVETDLVAALFEGDAEALLGLYGSRTIGGVHLDDIVRALTLVLQDLDGFGGVVGGNDAVADLALQQQGRGGVAGVGEGHEVAVGRHTVGTTSTGIGTGNGGVVEAGDIIDKVDLLQRIGQGQAHGSTSRRDVLERGSGGQTCGLLQFPDQLPSIEGVEEVDVAGAAVDDFDGQLALLHEDAGGFLVRIASVL